MKYFIIYSDMACTIITEAETTDELKEKLKKIQEDKNNFIELVVYGKDLTDVEF